MVSASGHTAGRRKTRIPHSATVAVAAALIVAGPATAHATSSTVYVGGPGCSDTNTGTQAAPFCTISHALSGAGPGTTVIVAPGTYNESVAVNASGSAGSPITIEAATRGTATITGGAHGFSVSGQHYVTIDGFVVTATSGEGVLLSNSDHLVVSNNTITGAGHPVQGQTAAGLLASGVTASQITGNHSDQNSDFGFRIDSGSSAVTVSGNEASYNAEGWQRNANGIDVVSAGNTIIGNVLHDNEDSGLQFYPGGDNNLAANNVTYNNGDHGIDDLNVSGTTLVGNTAYFNCTDGINVEGTSSNYIVENNISMDNAINAACAHGPAGKDGKGRAGEIGIYDSATIGTTVDYNLVYSTSGTDKLYEWGANGYTTLAAFQAASGQGGHELNGDPKFANAANGDFHLTEGSPAIDSANSGVTGAQNIDTTGNRRVDDPNVPNTGVGPRGYDDRGAYELPATGQPVLTARLAVTPNSGTAPLVVNADASGSTAGAYPIASYTFDFGDGSGPVTVNAPGASENHKYSGAGPFTATVTVRDTTGAATSTSAKVSVSAPTAPTAVLTVSPSVGTAPLTVTANGSASIAGTAAITGYSIDFGDGSPVQSTQTATHVYVAGTYTVTLTVTDANELTSKSTRAVTVNPAGSPITYQGRPAAEAVVATNNGTTTPVATATHAGDALVVSMYLTATMGCSAASGVGATDSGHNTYTVIVAVMDSSKHCTAVLAAFNTNALGTTDTVTFTWPSASKHNISIDEFSGITTADVEASGTGSAGGSTFSIPSILPAGTGELIFSAIGTNSGTAPTFDSTAGWRQLTPLALSSYRITSAYKVDDSGNCSAMGTTTAQWGAALVAFK